jgi:hypothetical protein
MVQRGWPLRSAQPLYSPDIGRFLQPDPASFDGDATNLYRYCGNNPTNYADSTGDLAYNVAGSFPNFSIQIPIRYSGPGATSKAIDTFNNGISYYLSRTFGPFNVCTSVVSENFWSNLVTVYTGAGFMKTMVGGPLGFWHAAGNGMPGHTPEFDAAHEAMHFLGQDDHYDRLSGQIIPRSGYENDIMGGLPGTFPSGDEMAAIINASQGTSTKWGHLPSGAPYVAFTQAPGLNAPTLSGMGGVPRRLRWLFRR